MNELKITIKEEEEKISFSFHGSDGIFIDQFYSEWKKNEIENAIVGFDGYTLYSNVTLNKFCETLKIDKKLIVELRTSLRFYTVDDSKSGRG